jgi:hypothetical protein
MGVLKGYTNLPMVNHGPTEHDLAKIEKIDGCPTRKTIKRRSLHTTSSI